MTLDATARKANALDSVKKYFVDSIFTEKKVPLSFDKALSVPKVQGSPSTVDKWVNILIGIWDPDTLSEFILTIFCCTRKDNEGFKLAQLVDNVSEFLIDTDGTYTDGMMRIPFYQSNSGDSSTWTQLGSFVVQDVIPSGSDDADDGTKFQTLTVRLRFASKA